MNRLQPQFYISFPVVQADFAMIIMDLSAYARLLRNARFVKLLIKNQAENPPGFEAHVIFEAIKNFKDVPAAADSIDQEELKTLHLNTYTDPRPFIPAEDETRHPLHLLTERFFWLWPTVNLGSARHALLLDMQLKGIGRNPLAVRSDHTHSWGGQYFWQSLKGYVVGHLFSGISPLGFLKTQYVAMRNEDLKSRQIKSSAVSFTIREADALRVTQVMTNLDPYLAQNKNQLLDNFLKKNQVSSAQEHLDKIIFHYASLFLMGLRHMAVTRENVTLEGRLLDYEDVILDTDQENFHYFLITNKCYEKSAPGYVQFEGERLYASSLHFYLDAIELTAMGLGQLDEKLKITKEQLREKLLAMITILGQSVFEIDPEFMSFLSLIIKHESSYDKGDTHTNGKGDDATDLLNALKRRPHRILMTEDGHPFQAIHYQVDYPRPKLRDSRLEQLNQNKFSDTLPVTEKLFKLIQLEFFAGKLTFEKMLNFSSLCNQEISAGQLVYPYELCAGKPKLKINSRSDLIKEINEKWNNKFITLVEEVCSDVSLIKGYKISINGSEHFVSITPGLYPA